VARGQVRVLKTSIPYVSRVENRSPAIGGAEAETLDDAKARGPLLLRSRGRAVTAADFEELARDIAPDAARVHCVAEEGTTFWRARARRAACRQRRHRAHRTS
jgi:hypothetical protein